MAAPTWRNVQAGNQSGAAAALAGATRTFDNAFGQLQETLEQPAKLSLQNYKEGQRREQEAFDNSLRTAANERAEAGLELRQAEGDRATQRLESDLLTAEANRALSQEQEKRAKARFGQEQLDNKRRNTRTSNLETANAKINEVLSNSTWDDVQSNLTQLAVDSGLQGADVVNFVNDAMSIDQDLHGLTETQSQVLAEQQLFDEAQNRSFRERLTRQLETVAASAGVSPQVLDMQRDPNSADALLNQYNEKSGGEATELNQYFLEKAGRPLTESEFRYIAGLTAEEDWTPFASGQIDLDKRGFLGLFPGGYTNRIDTYLETIGVGDSDKAKNNRARLDGYYSLRSDGDRVAANLQKTQRENLAKLKAEARKNRISRRAGNDEVESILAAPVSTQGTRELEKLLLQNLRTQTGVSPDFNLSGYLTGRY